MKKTIGIIVGSALLFGGSTAFASTTPTSVDQLITQLMQQISDLKTKIAALQEAQHNVQTSAQDANSTLKLINGLKPGMTGDQVTLLQSVLASDPSVYPEGLITGYYGALTDKAIKRFQRKHGLLDNGIIGTSTMANINIELKRSPIGRERDDNDDDRGNKNNIRLCLTIPPGHLIAPGWLKHHGEDAKKEGKGNGWGEDTILPRCKSVTGTTTPPVTPDTAAPVITALSISSVSDTQGTLSWTTGESARSEVFIGTTSPVDTGTASWTDGTFVITHSHVVTGLSANTVYYYKVSATDSSGNRSVSSQGTFTTNVTPDTTAPVISSLSIGATGSSSATATWTTDEAANTVVYYGLTSPLSTSTASVATNAALVTVHSIDITGLSASTTYYAIVSSSDTAGNEAHTSEVTFTTPL